ncbi:MAG: glycosyltransferase family 2 protein [Rhodospirillales bacterium]
MRNGPSRSADDVAIPVAVVIPAFEEAATIAAVATDVLRHCPSVIVVDDGSRDGTADQLTGLPVTLLRHERNQGKAASLWTGIEAALARGASAVITMDGDGQHPADAIPRMLEAAADDERRLVMAARLHCRDRMPSARRFGNGMADFWISWAAGCRITDTQSGFRLYPAALLRRLTAVSYRQRRRGFVFESEVLIDAARAGFRPYQVPIDAIYERTSRASHYRPVADTLAIIAMVAGKLLARGMYVQGLIRSLRR